MTSSVREALTKALQEQENEKLRKALAEYQLDYWERAVNWINSSIKDGVPIVSLTYSSYRHLIGDCSKRSLLKRMNITIFSFGGSKYMSREDFNTLMDFKNNIMNAKTVVVEESSSSLDGLTKIKVIQISKL